MRNLQHFVTAAIIACFSIGLLSAQPVFRGESVEYDPASKRWFTSDDGVSIIQRDSNAVVSYFGSNLRASHGMEVMGNTLFVCEGTKIYGYDLTTAQEVMQVSVPGASFLNGLTNNGVDKLYATCFTNKKIFEINVSSLSFPAVTEIVSATVSKPNGILYDALRNRLVFVNWGASAQIQSVDLNGFAVSTLLTTSLGNIDGIDDDGLGHYYVSSWSPIRISRIDTSFVGAPVTISAPGISNPADICYAKVVDTLGIPNGNGPVIFIGFGPVVSMEEARQSAGLMACPNPVTENSYLQFNLLQAGHVKLELLNMDGRRCMTLVNDEMGAGVHKVLLAGLALPKGNYIAHLTGTAAVKPETLRLVLQ